MLLATVGKDGNGLKSEKVGPSFSSPSIALETSLKTSYGLLFRQKFTWDLPLGVEEAFCVKARVIRCNLVQF